MTTYNKAKGVTVIEVREKNFQPVEEKEVGKQPLYNQDYFKDDAKEIVLNWLEHTSSHGLPNIIRARHGFFRFLWIFVFLISIGYCSKVIITSFIDFYDYKTTISTEYVRDSPTRFPALTICNLNPFNEANAMSYIRSKTESIFDPECLGANPIADRWYSCLNSSNVNLDLLLDIIKRSILNDNLSGDALQKLGFNLNDMLLRCNFNGYPCNAGWFYEFWHNEYGLCYTFNSGLFYDALNTSAVGYDFGLSLDLVTQPPNKTVFDYRTGIYVLVHNQTKKPIILTDGLMVSNNVQTYIGFKRTVTVRNEYPYSDCLKDLTPFSNYSRKIFGYFEQLNISYYDQSLCLNLCYQDIVVKTCNCCSTVTDRIGCDRFCLTEYDLFCEFGVKIEFSISDTNVICENVCRQQCTSEKFELSTSMANYPSESYYKVLTRIAFPDRLLAKDSLLGLIVNYNDLSYMRITENPAVTFESLIGNVGGQLGLFIGISLLSLLEILEILSELLILICKRCIIAKVKPLDSSALDKCHCEKPPVLTN